MPSLPSLDDIRVGVDACTLCELGRYAGSKVFGEGPPDAEVMFVGEAPGKEEDKSGRPFIGPAGQVLNKALEHLGISRDRIFICNILKCRPTDGFRNRTPSPEEVGACLSWVEAQIEAVAPKVVVALGGTAAKALLEVNLSVGKIRGKIMAGPHRTLTVVTYHPSYLLRKGDKELQKESAAYFIDDLRLAFIQAGWLEPPKKAKKKAAKKKRKKKNG
jgi:DNA polymerase